METNLITLRQASELLVCTEQVVLEKVKKNELKTVKIAGDYIRFSKKDIISYINANETYKVKSSFFEKIKDFFYFNDFYIISVLIVFVLVLAIVFF